MDQSYLRGPIAIFVLAGLTFLLVTPEWETVLADEINDGVFAIDSEPYGLTYEEWTIKFWQWLLPIPSETSPMNDMAGERCGENQGDLPVFFLVFTGGGEAERTCNIPAGKAILVPINVVECSFLELPGAQTEEELHVCAEEDESSNPGVFLSVDGTELRELLGYRVHSEAFDVTFSDIFGTTGGPTRAVSDGYWVILEPLLPGPHEIHFKAVLTNPQTGVLIYSDDVLYHLNVVEASESSLIPLQGSTISGNYRVEVNWASADIGSENTFILKIMDANGQELSGATYDIMIFKGNQQLNETYRSDQTSLEQKYTFNEASSYTIRIENINDSGDSDYVIIPIQVTPEFPLGMFALMVTLFGIIVVAARSKNHFFREYSNYP